MTAGGWLIYGSGCSWAEATFPQAILFMSQAEQLVYWKMHMTHMEKNFKEYLVNVYFVYF